MSVDREPVENVQMPIVDEKKVDREKVCPMLIRLFTNISEHNSLREYGRNRVPPNEINVHTWKDCTLRELLRHIKQNVPEARRRGTQCKFAIVGADNRTLIYRSRDIGSVTTGGKSGPEDMKTLSECQFIPGDFIDVAIIPPAYGGYGRVRYFRRHPY